MAKTNRVPPPAPAAGSKSGILTVIEETPYVSSGGRISRGLKVKCDCGTEKTIVLSEFGRTQSCGCQKRKGGGRPVSFIINSGDVFTRLTVTSIESSEGRGRVIVCRCECGNEVKAMPSNLKNGATKSCGCLSRELASVRAIERNTSDFRIDAEGRECAKCSKYKLWDEYYLANNVHGHKSYCKACTLIDHAERRSGKDESTLRVKDRKNTLWSRYRLTTEEYDAYLESVGRVCEICGKEEVKVTPQGDTHSLAVDHDHACCEGKRTCGECLRGVLCDYCNMALGRVESIGIAKILAYLNKPRTGNPFKADFYEDDEPVEKVIDAFDSGKQQFTEYIEFSENQIDLAGRAYL